MENSRLLSIETARAQAALSPAAASRGPVDLIVDSSDLKVCGQGEWHRQKHDEKKRKRWKKLHIGVDAQGQVIAATVTEIHEQDPSQVPSLLAQIDSPVDRFNRGW